MVSDDRHGGNLSLSLTFPDTHQQVRLVGTMDKPEWIAADVCDVLEIGNIDHFFKPFSF